MLHVYAITHAEICPESFTLRSLENNDKTTSSLVLFLLCMLILSVAVRGFMSPGSNARVATDPGRRMRTYDHQDYILHARGLSYEYNNGDHAT